MSFLLKSFECDCVIIQNESILFMLCANNNTVSYLLGVSTDNLALNDNWSFPNELVSVPDELT